MLLVVVYIHSKKRKTTDLMEWDKGLVPEMRVLNFLFFEKDFNYICVSMCECVRKRGSLVQFKRCQMFYSFDIVFCFLVFFTTKAYKIKCHLGTGFTVTLVYTLKICVSTGDSSSWRKQVSAEKFNYSPEISIM